MKKTDKPIIVEEIYQTSLKNVWKAITEPNQMNQWFFEQIQSFKAEEGFQTEFLVEVENRKFTHLWTIAEVKLHHKIKYQWRYREYPGDSFVTFELMEENKKTRLKLTAEVKEDFPGNIPEFKRESCVGGWNYFIKESLKNYLDTGK
ncbi:SRPBCC family protein [Spongiimicrobium sp. 3-5]|uniref:SRPBCC family protein n=1 Tax=Spongiimicrobium sp. 3-5 TaxID=3332596 RepID=UPI00397FEDFE